MALGLRVVLGVICRAPLYDRRAPARKGAGAVAGVVSVRFAAESRAKGRVRAPERCCAAHGASPGGRVRPGIEPGRPLASGGDIYGKRKQGKTLPAARKKLRARHIQTR
ncbi:hypothetical protein GCM10011534_04570 [Pseudooceanicola nanhaiensis]|uniref:Uncharacterized protein n=1 Tax=Pseudooceanicola nanhaiensis TaxID=375761 RepID=A0A917WB13_9RHOB|nr:hypothetical protein GCM10011534_04570 [Pseudooceanicola nanhaiensis]